MKLKLIAAAAVLAASGAANAAIDNGQDGSGEFFFNIFNETSSYTVGLGFEQSQFVTALAATGDFSFTANLAADDNFQSFAAGVTDWAAVQWNVLAFEGVGGRTINQTYTDGTLPAIAQTSTNGRAMAGAMLTFVNNVNNAMATGAKSIYVDDNTLVTYAGILGCNNTASTQEFSNCGTNANSSLDTGLSFLTETYAGSGTARGAFAQVTDGGIPVKVFLDAGNTLHMVAAVPEPETYAMLLAGLGLMGAVARRRQNKA